MQPDKLSSFAFMVKKLEVLAMVGVMALIVMGQSAPPNTASTHAKPRVYIDWKDTSFLSTEASQPFDAIAAFNRACPEAATSTDQKQADFILRMNHERDPGSSDLYRWEILGAKGHTQEQTRAGLDVALRHACNAGIMTLWHNQQSADNRK